ncbi:MAG: hypothetical protein AMXMBFR23_20850 [Chloroflexota bacterium]
MFNNMTRTARHALLFGGLALAGLTAVACSSDEDAEATPVATAEVTAAATSEATASPTEAAQPAIEVAEIRARATPGLENENSAAYAKITNRGAEADRLVGASVDASIAATVELHTTVKEGDMMRMQQVDGWDIAPGETLELAPGGNHVMILGLVDQFEVGERFTLTLIFEQAGEIQVEVPVMEIATSGMGGMATPGAMN